jgi:hypothetical protein
MIPVSRNACWTSGLASVSRTIPIPGSRAFATIPINGRRRRIAT